MLAPEDELEVVKERRCQQCCRLSVLLLLYSLQAAATLEPRGFGVQIITLCIAVCAIYSLATPVNTSHANEKMSLFM